MAVNEEKARTKRSANKLPEELLNEFNQHISAFYEAMEDDLNTAAALGHVFGVVRLIYKVLEDKTLRLSANTPELLDKFEAERVNWVNILGVFGQDPAQFSRNLNKFR